jgi:hypothetical protein
MADPLCEDDYPEDVRVVSFLPITQGKEKRAFNYIREEGQDFFRPLNVQFEEEKDGKEETQK